MRGVHWFRGEKVYPVEKLIFVPVFCGSLCSRGVSKAHQIVMLWWEWLGRLKWRATGLDASVLRLVGVRGSGPPVCSLFPLCRFSCIACRLCFMNRLRGLSLRLRQQGFLTDLLQRTFTKFFNRHGLIVVKYGATLREMRFAIRAWIAPSYPYITYLFIT